MKVNLRSALAHYFRLILRRSRLQALPQLIRFSRLTESPKVATYHHRGVALLHSLTLLVPLAAAIALIVLNVKNVVTGNVTSTTLTGLQFAAKFTEILIQASLADILLSVIRSQLLSTTVPLGALTAPYRTSDISFLWSAEFLGSLRSRSASVRYLTLLWISIPLCIILAALVGPSSAVLMIPRRVEVTTASSLIALDPVQDAFPQVVGPQMSKASQGYDDVVSRALVSYDYVGPAPSSPGKISTSVTDDVGVRLLDSIVETLALDDISGVFSSTLPTKLVFMLAGPYGGLSLDGESVVTHALQPNVTSSCTFYDLALHGEPKSGNTYVDFGSGNEALGSLVRIADLTPNAAAANTSNNSSILSFADGNTVYTYFWHDVDVDSVGHSTIMVKAQWDFSNSTIPFTLTACTFDAFWTQARASLDTAANELDSQLCPGSQQNQKLIQLSSEWVKNVVATYLKSWLGQNEPIVTNILITLALSDLSAPDLGTTPDVYKYVFNCPDNTEDCPAQVFIANLDHHSIDVTVAQCIAIVDYSHTHDVNNQYTLGVSLYTHTPWSDPQNLTFLGFHVYSQSYGYNTQTTPVRLSLAVISLYVLVTMLYIAYTLFTGRSATSWDSMSELFMLGLNSHRPEYLKATSVGVDTLATFEEPVSVRINGQNSAEVVFKKDKDVQMAQYSAVVANVKY